MSWVWWRAPVIPATQEAEAGESLESGRRRLRTELWKRRQSAAKGAQSIEEQLLVFAAFHIPHKRQKAQPPPLSEKQKGNRTGLCLLGVSGHHYCCRIHSKTVFFLKKTNPEDSPENGPEAINHCRAPLVFFMFHSNCMRSGRLRRADQLRSGIQAQPDQHGCIGSMAPGICPASSEASGSLQSWQKAKEEQMPHVARAGARERVGPGRSHTLLNNQIAQELTVTRTARE
ncbi:hypothetical protein AAY473_032445 [Plecturocebus cupreus]